MCCRNLAGIATPLRAPLSDSAGGVEFGVFLAFGYSRSTICSGFIRPTPVLRFVIYPRHNFRVFDTFRMKPSQEVPCTASDYCGLRSCSWPVRHHCARRTTCILVICTVTRPNSDGSGNGCDALWANLMWQFSARPNQVEA